jgi:cellulose synthase/poly-beta-1,6-N-acetylglucosamine synthase-like glycosyltransferase
MNKPLISIVITVKNAENTLRRCLDSVLGIDYENYEVIVVDDGSRDKTSEILKDYSARIRMILNSASLGPSKARNSACAVAKGEYLAFTDGDCIVDRNWLSELLQGFKEDNIVAVGGAQKVPDDESLFGRKVSVFMQKVSAVTGYLHKEEEAGRFVAHNPTCTSMYKKDIFLKEGGFREHLWPGEDVELDYRLTKKGYRLFYSPAAVVYHYRSGNLGSFVKMMYRYGQAQAWLVGSYGIFRKIQALPFFILAVLLLGILSFFYNALNLYFLVLFGSAVIFLVLLKINFDMFGLFILTLIYWNLGFLKGLLFSSNPIKSKP